MITMAIVLFFYLVVLYRKPGKFNINRTEERALFVTCYVQLMMSFYLEVNWGSSTQAQTYRAALTSIQQLVHIEEHVKNYRPQILVLTGLPNTRPALVDFAYLICKNNSLMICGNILKVILNDFRLLFKLIFITNYSFTGKVNLRSAVSTARKSIQIPSVHQHQRFLFSC